MTERIQLSIYLKEKSFYQLIFRRDFHTSHHDLISLQRMSSKRGNFKYIAVDRTENTASIAGARDISRSLRNFFARSRSMLSRKQPYPLSPVVEETGHHNMFHFPSFHRSHTQETEDSHPDPHHLQLPSTSGSARSGRGAGLSQGSAINKCVVKFKSLLGRNKDKDTE